MLLTYSLDHSPDAGLDGLEEAEVVGVLAQTPSSNATKAAGLDDVVELAGDKSRGVPSPEERSGGIPVPLAAVDLVGVAVGHGGLERAEGGGAVADTVVGLAAVTAVGSSSTAAMMLVEIPPMNIGD